MTVTCNTTYNHTGREWNGKRVRGRTLRSRLDETKGAA